MHCCLVNKEEVKARKLRFRADAAFAAYSRITKSALERKRSSPHLLPVSTLLIANAQFPVVMRLGETPGPIPNTMVKT